MEKSIEEKVIALVADKLGVDIKDVKPESTLTGDLGADSLDAVEILMEAENDFGIKIPDEDAEKIKTVGDIVTYIQAHK